MKKIVHHVIKHWHVEKDGTLTRLPDEVKEEVTYPADVSVRWDGQHKKIITYTYTVPLRRQRKKPITKLAQRVNAAVWNDCLELVKGGGNVR